MIDFQSLLSMASMLDELPPERFDLGIWLDSCGTVGCAIGNWCLAHPADRMFLRDDMLGPELDGATGFSAIALRFGITYTEAMFLFAVAYHITAVDMFDERCEGKRERFGEPATQTAARIRKFCYYKLRKSEILADYETARQQEGDWLVCPGVMEAVR